MTTLDKIVAKYHLQKDTYEPVDTANLSSTIKAILRGDLEEDVYMVVVGDPKLFWRKSNPFQSISHANMYVIEGSEPYIELVVTSDRSTERRKEKWAIQTALKLGVEPKRVLITIQVVSDGY